MSEISQAQPTVSVLLPVYNGASYLDAAIESILSQTFRDFEFLIIDDGSTDESSSILKRYTDPRIRSVHQANRGLAGTLNIGIEMAKGTWIARQDQDDVSHPERLARQLSYFHANPSCVLLGTAAEILEGDRRSGRFHRHPTDANRLRYELLFNNPFVHSSVMFPRAVVREIGGYSTDRARQPPEDYELWSRLSRQGQVANLAEPLLIYREVQGSMSRLGPSPFRDHLVRISAENIAMAAGVNPGDAAALHLAALTHGATDLIQRPDFEAMRKMLHAAVDSIEKNSVELHREANERVQALRGMHLADRSAFGKILRMPGPLRNFAKACFRILMALKK